MPRFDDKLEIQKQWNADPCGADTAGGAPAGTAAFYREVERYRYEVYAPWMKDLIDFGAHAGQRVLEIGPGLGTDHAQLARGGARMFGLDLATTHLDHTRRRFLLEGLATRLVRGDAEALPFASESLDLVYSFGVIHHTPDMDAAIAEVHRVLRPGGTAIVGLYHRDSAFYWIRTILLRGILRGGLLLKGYRRLLSEIERRSQGSEAVPLVQVVSRRRCRRLFAPFSGVTLQVRHIDLPHALPLVGPASRRLRQRLERFAARWGWYLIVFARR